MHIVSKDDYTRAIDNDVITYQQVQDLCQVTRGTATKWRQRGVPTKTKDGEKSKAEMVFQLAPEFFAGNNVAENLLPDYAEAQQFLDVLASTGESDFHTFQTFDDSKQKRAELVCQPYGDLKQYRDALAELNQKGAGVYVTVNETDGIGRRATNITRVRAVFADFDGAPLPETWPLEPTMVIQSSSGKWHAYWLVDGLLLDQFTPVQKAIAKTFGSDPVVCDLPRVMRVPGFFHCKGSPYKTELVKVAPEHRYTADQILEAFQVGVVQTEATQHTTGVVQTEVTRYTTGDHVVDDSPENIERARQWVVNQELAVEGDGGDRHTAMHIATGLRDFGLSQEVALSLLMEEGGWNNRCKPSWKTEELRKKIRSGYKSATGDQGSRSVKTISSMFDAVDTSDDTSDSAHTRAVQAIDAAIKLLTEGDDGAHWEESVIESARFLYATDRPMFQRKRTEIKDTSGNAQISEWTALVRGAETEERDSTLADVLVNMVNNVAELFHDAEDNCYATFTHKGHRETWALGSRGFATWLGFKAYKEAEFCPGDLTIKQALSVLNGIARFDGEEIPVHVRCAPHDGGYLIDMANDAWQAVHVTPGGWRVVDNPGVRFVRSSTATALPSPANSDIELLWKYALIKEEDRPLLLAFMLECWRPETPFPVLSLLGEQGSAKSSTHTCIRQLVDPNAVPRRATPKAVEDIYVSASNNWLASFENISHLTPAMQDALCTMATGGGFAKRKLYSDADESVIEVKRPVVINGIVNVVTRPDLIDRAIVLLLPVLDASKRKTEIQLNAEYEKDAPAILAGLLDLFAATLAAAPAIHIDEPPRMIDFAYLGQAMMVAMGTKVVFTQLYGENRNETLAQSVEASPAALAIREYMIANPGRWEGTMNALYQLLHAGHIGREGYPKSPRGLGEVLRRLAPALRAEGIKVTLTGRQNDGRHVSIYLNPNKSD